MTAHTEVAFGLAPPVEADEIQQKATAKRHSLSWRPEVGQNCLVIPCHGVDLLSSRFFMPRSCVGDGRLFSLMRNMHKQGKLAHAEPWVMQADCYLCLSGANLKITRVALCLQSCHTDTPWAATGTTLKDNICQSTILNGKVSTILNRSHLLWENRILAFMTRRSPYMQLNCLKFVP